MQNDSAVCSEDFRLIKAKIIKTHDMLVMYNDKSEKLNKAKKALQALSQLKTDLALLTQKHERMSCKTQQLTETLKEKERQMVEDKREYDSLQKLYSQQYSEHQTTVSEYQNQLQELNDKKSKKLRSYEKRLSGLQKALDAAQLEQNLQDNEVARKPTRDTETQVDSVQYLNKSCQINNTDDDVHEIFREMTIPLMISPFQELVETNEVSIQCNRLVVKKRRVVSTMVPLNQIVRKRPRKTQTSSRINKGLEVLNALETLKKHKISVTVNDRQNIEELHCWSSTCLNINQQMILNGNEELLGFTTSVNCPNKLNEICGKIDDLIEQLKKRKIRRTVSEFSSATETELESLFRDPLETLRRNRELVAAARDVQSTIDYDSDYCSQSLTTVSSDGDIYRTPQHIPEMISPLKLSPEQPAGTSDRLRTRTVSLTLESVISQQSVDCGSSESMDFEERPKRKGDSNLVETHNVEAEISNKSKRVKRKSRCKAEDVGVSTRRRAAINKLNHQKPETDFEKSTKISEAHQAESITVRVEPEKVVESDISNQNDVQTGRKRVANIPVPIKSKQPRRNVLKSTKFQAPTNVQQQCDVVSQVIDDMTKSLPVPKPKIVPPTQSTAVEATQRNESLNLTPPKKIKLLSAKQALTAIRELLQFPNESIIFLRVVQKFLFQPTEFICRVVLRSLLLDGHGECTSSGDGPPLTVAQKLFLVFLNKLHNTNHPNIFETFLNMASKQVYTRKNPSQIERISRFYAAICLLNGDLDRLRLFVSESFYFCSNCSPTILSCVLNVWPNVLPHCNEGFLLSKVWIHIINTTSQKCDEQLKNTSKKILIKDAYGYPVERYDCHEFFLEIFEEYCRNPLSHVATITLLIFLKNQPVSFIQNIVQPKLLTTYQEVSSSNANLKSHFLLLIANICASLKNKQGFISKVIQWFDELELSEDDMIVKNSILLAKNRLTTARRKIKKKKGELDI